MYICIFYMFVLVSLRILKIFRTAILWTPEASYFHYYVMQQFFINQKCFICIYFNGDTGRRLLIVCFLIFQQDHLLFPVICANTNYIFFNWGCFIYFIYVYLYSRIFVGDFFDVGISTIQ